MEGVKTKHFRQTGVWRGASPPLLAFLSLCGFCQGFSRAAKYQHVHLIPPLTAMRKTGLVKIA